MNKATARRKKLLNILMNSKGPVTASALADELAVSRQIIVGDVAVQRASGDEITATPKGYIPGVNKGEAAFGYTGILACKHTTEELLDELYTVVDFGATVIDVTVEHPVYGELKGMLNVSSRYDADQFAAKSAANDSAQPLSTITDGIHVHRIGCPDKKIFELVRLALKKKKYLLQD